MKVSVISANLGSFDVPVPMVVQNGDDGVLEHRFTDQNFPPRHCTMTPRLQARIPKMFGWQMEPIASYKPDIIIWHDASMALLHPDSVSWLVSRVENADIAFFRHPFRHSIKEEADYIRERIKNGDTYLKSRYENELLDEQVRACLDDIPAPIYQDDTLYATTVFVYRNIPAVHELLEKWWVHTSRYHAVDQLAIPYLVKKAQMKNNLKVYEIQDNLYKTQYLTHTRNRTWKQQHQAS